MVHGGPGGEAQPDVAGARLPAEERVVRAAQLARSRLDAGEERRERDEPAEPDGEERGGGAGEAYAHVVHQVAARRLACDEDPAEIGVGGEPGVGGGRQAVLRGDDEGVQPRERADAVAAAVEVDDDGEPPPAAAKGLITRRRRPRAAS
jgi:hypothetical protein